MKENHVEWSSDSGKRFCLNNRNGNWHLAFTTLLLPRTELVVEAFMVNIFQNYWP